MNSEVVQSFLPLRPVQLHVLISLGERDRHGYGIIRDTAKRSGEEVRLEMGTLYRALHRMLEAGLVEESDQRPAPEVDDQRRRYYRLTEHGREVVRAEATRLSELVESARKGGLSIETARATG